MQARFVSLAAGYALGGGTLRRKGVRQRPWLELRRLETESIYLGHQARALQRCSSKGFRCVIDQVPGEGFYDVARCRIHDPALERVMELLQPGGEQQITPAVLQVAGLRGLASLWLDRGGWEGRAGILHLSTPGDATCARSALAEQRIPCALIGPGGTWLRLAPEPMGELAALLRPHVHRSMRHALRPGSCHGLQLFRAAYPGKRAP